MTYTVPSGKVTGASISIPDPIQVRIGHHLFPFGIKTPQIKKDTSFLFQGAVFQSFQHQAEDTVIPQVGKDIDKA